MLYELEIENFYSVRNAQLIDLKVAANVPDLPGRFAPLWEGSRDRAPKVVAIFGPNAAGKSTILRALSFVAWFVRDSFSSRPVPNSHSRSSTVGRGTKLERGLPCRSVGWRTQTRMTGMAPGAATIMSSRSAPTSKLCRKRCTIGRRIRDAKSVSSTEMSTARSLDRAHLDLVAFAKRLGRCCARMRASSRRLRS